MSNGINTDKYVIFKDSNTKNTAKKFIQEKGYEVSESTDLNELSSWEDSDKEDLPQIIVKLKDEPGPGHYIGNLKLLKEFLKSS